MVARLASHDIIGRISQELYDVVFTGTCFAILPHDVIDTGTCFTILPNDTNISTMAACVPIKSRSKTWLLGILLVKYRVQAETQNFEILMPPTDLYVHYADGYVVGPDASVDLSSLKFVAVSGAYTNNKQDDDARDAVMGDDASLADNDDKGSDRERHHRTLDGGVEVDASYLDIVVFKQPEQCANSREGCDWTKIGVGGILETENSSGGLRWCCSQGAVDAGLCDGSDYRQWQRLIINQTLFEGTTRSITVPREGGMSKKLRSGELELDQTGRYVILFANCDEEGRDIMVTGKAIWKSRHGNLPGELFQFMHFYTLLLAGYLALIMWYAFLMKQNESSRIDIENFVFITILLGLIEVTVRGVDYHTWNWVGERKEYLTYLGIILGSMKHGSARALLVMVALGWGVIRDSLGTATKKIISLAVVYVGVVASRGLVILFAVQDMQTLSFQTEVKLFDAATILTFVVAAIDIIFVIWILVALDGTMQYLEGMRQSRKLARYLKLRMIFLFGVLFSTFMAVFSLVDAYNEDGIVREEHEWIVEAAAELKFFVVLSGIAFLWKPNPSAKEYAFAMELPLSGEGDTELEMTDTVPSALSDDEDDPANERLKVDDAQHT
ncbi:hypothetical protein MPSEU_000365600 [Mayamaea pseudoterrestris]|nr:hypothetical protein MPSEU_000365600 [Mayamaea pseudoterrestris]